MNKLVKQGIRQYRTVNGKRFSMYTSNPDEFETCKKECKENKIKYKIVDNQFYKEQK